MAQEVISALTITEKWVKAKVGLKHDNLDDVKSLSLPGSSNEKIVHLGNALQGFTRLKHLDLSRNNISVLDGLEHLKMLECLILYYNAVGSLKELYKLRHNMNLKELDVRLNPITKLEPDYRLFAIHMLPNLRILDDRQVRDSDRKAALEHFTSDQASEFEVRPEKPTNKSERVQVPRVDLVQRFANRPSALEEEDVAIIDLISKGTGRWKAPHHATSSKIEKPSAEDYTKDELKDLSPRGATAELTEELTPSAQYYKQSSKVSHNGTHAQDSSYSFANHMSTSTNAVPYLSYAAFSSFTATPQHRSSRTNDDSSALDPSKASRHRHEISDDGPNGKERHAYRDHHNHEKTSSKDMNEASAPKAPKAYTEYVNGEVYVRQAEEQRKQVLVPAGHANSTSKDIAPSNDQAKIENDSHAGSKSNGYETPKLLLQDLLALVDRYWNGNRSLQKNFKFQGLALNLLNTFKEDSSVARNAITSYREKELLDKIEEKSAQLVQYEEMMKIKGTEIEHLKQKLKNDEEIQETLKMANNDLTLLHNKLTEMQGENIDLKSKIATLEADDNSKEKLKNEINEIKREVMKLDSENRNLNQQCRQQSETLTQLQELTTMLQESHRSLVVTNDHLLQEIHEEKQRHQHEVNQLHWSYEQLKKTADWLPKVSR